MAIFWTSKIVQSDITKNLSGRKITKFPQCGWYKYLRTNFGYFMQIWWAYNACTSFKNNRITAHISPWSSILHFPLRFLNFGNGLLLLKVGFMGTKQLSYLSRVVFFEKQIVSSFFTKIQIKHFRWTVEPIEFVHNKVTSWD